MAKKVPVKRSTESDETRIRTRINAQGYTVAKVIRIFPPKDEGGEAEVLFLGRWRGDSRMGLLPDTEDLPYTAHIQGDRTIVTVSW